MEMFEIARRWCEQKGHGWSVLEAVGTGGTATVFSISSPQGKYALKIYDSEFSNGDRGAIEERRLEMQLELGEHDCPYLIKTYDAGRFDDRLYLLMNDAQGNELAKVLKEVPREKIRLIIDQVARACKFLRDRGICHRDIKSANIVVSSEFDHATLLDLSVIRDIHDPVGLGTDQENRLPVVATARYSPPEYLFRLLDPGADLWHALDVYQLGGVLHDLIMQEQLFESEYSTSKENRYRFAWTVATSLPDLHASDIDQDLVFLARRALDKDWKRRSALRIENFLADAAIQRRSALAVFGVRTEIDRSNAVNQLALIRRVREIASELEQGVSRLLHQSGIIARHVINPGASDLRKLISFQWDIEPSEFVDISGAIELKVALALSQRGECSFLECKVELAAGDGESRRSANLTLHEFIDQEGIAEDMAQQIELAFTELCVVIIQSKVDE